MNDTGIDMPNREMAITAKTGEWACEPMRIEVAPGKFDWRDYDRMMDLAAENGIRVTIAEMITAAPEWMYDCGSRKPRSC